MTFDDILRFLGLRQSASRTPIQQAMTPQRLPPGILSSSSDDGSAYSDFGQALAKPPGSDDEIYQDLVRHPETPMKPIGAAPQQLQQSVQQSDLQRLIGLMRRAKQTGTELPWSGFDPALVKQAQAHLSREEAMSQQRRL